MGERLIQGRRVVARVLVASLAALAACEDDGDGFTDGGTGGDRVELDDVTLTTEEDTPVSGTVPATAPDGAAIEVTIEEPRHGTLTRDGLEVTYTPAADFHGAENLTVIATAGSRTASAILRIVVEPVNDAPVAADDHREGASEDADQSFLIEALVANDTDVEGDALTISAVDMAVGGTVAIEGNQVVFHPAGNVPAEASFRYTVDDGHGGTDTATVTIAFNTVNDAPIAGDDAVTTAEDTPVDLTAATLLANDTDPEGDTLTIVDFGNAVNGDVTRDGDTFTFTPDEGFNGTASFQYEVSDGALTDVGTVTITVTGVNEAPVANDDTASTTVNTPVDVEAADLLDNDTDGDGDTLTVTDAGNATHGDVSLAGTTITFTPETDFVGEGSFTYTISDGNGGTDTATVTVTIASGNTPPVAVDDAILVARDESATIPGATLTGNDLDDDEDALTVTAVTNPTNGTVSVTNNVVTFTPDAGYTGPASFDYTVSDGNGGTDTGHVDIDVVPPTLQLTADDCQVVEASVVAGDDRGGLAVGSSTLVYNGDGAGSGQAASFSLADHAVAAPIVGATQHDTLFSALSTGQLYLLGNGASPIEWNGLSAQVSTVTSILEIDPTTGAIIGQTNLSQSIVISGTQGDGAAQSGIFVDGGRIILFSTPDFGATGHAWHVDISSGFVTDFGWGAMAPFERNGCDTFLTWGVVENIGGEPYLVYVKDSTTIARRRIPDGAEGPVETFTDLGDMCMLSVSRSLDRWYFHYEGTAQFGAFTEAVGSCDASVP